MKFYLNSIDCKVTGYENLTSALYNVISANTIIAVLVG